MKEQTLTLKFIPHHRVDVDKIKALGFKEVPRMPRRIRWGKEDDMRKFQQKLPSRNLLSAKFHEVKEALSEDNYIPDDILIYGKTPVALLRMEEREYTLPFWK